MGCLNYMETEEDGRKRAIDWQYMVVGSTMDMRATPIAEKPEEAGVKWPLTIFGWTYGSLKKFKTLKLRYNPFIRFRNSKSQKVYFIGHKGTNFKFQRYTPELSA